MDLANMIEAITETAAVVEDGMNKYSAVQSLIIGEELSDTQIESLREFKCIQDYLDLPLNDPKEGSLKKVFAGAISAADDLGILPFDLPDSSAEAIASIADESLNRIKVAYKVATNQLDIEATADVMVDHMAARTVAVLDYTIDNAAGYVAGFASAVLTSLCPPAAVLTPVIHVGMAYAAEKTKDAIHKVVPAIKEAAKPIVRKTIGVVKSVTKSIGSKISNWLFG